MKDRGRDSQYRTYGHFKRKIKMTTNILQYTLTQLRLKVGDTERTGYGVPRKVRRKHC